MTTKKKSPTARTLEWLRHQGWTCQVVEKWIPFTKQRKDLFDCIDIVAIHPDVQGVLGVQATANNGGHHANRLQKILENPKAALWMNAGNKLWVVSWAKQGPRGAVKKWVGRCDALKASDFPEATDD